MSVIAIKNRGKGKWEISADSIRTNGWSQEKDKNAKLWKIGDIIVGTAGYCSIGSLFKEYVENNKPKTNNEYGWINRMAEFSKYLSGIDPTLRVENNHFIVAYKGKAFQFEGFFIREIKDYSAIGAGRDFAITALKLGHDTRKACEIACELSVYCEKPINTFNV